MWIILATAVGTWNLVIGYRTGNGGCLFAGGALLGMALAMLLHAIAQEIERRAFEEAVREYEARGAARLLADLRREVKEEEIV